MDFLKDTLEHISFFDLSYVIITILSLAKCTKKGFVLSILSASKWLLAYVITLVLFPKIKPYVEDVIDNEYVLDITLGFSIFVLVIFVILLINKGVSKTVRYTGLGTLDSVFGFLFGFVRAYIICVCLFATTNIIYKSEMAPV